MKRIIITSLIITGLSACGEKKEDQAKNTPQDTKETAKEVKQTKYSGWELVTLLEEGKSAEELAQDLSGELITITDLLVGNEHEYWGVDVYGYNPGTEVSYTSEVSYGDLQHYSVAGKDRFQYQRSKAIYFKVHLGEDMNNDQFESKNNTSDHDMNLSEMIYSGTLSISTDSVHVDSQGALVFENVTIIEHQTF